MSRLARNSKDWSDLFEVSAIFRTLIADEEGEGGNRSQVVARDAKQVIARLAWLLHRFTLVVVVPYISGSFPGELVSQENKF